LLSRTTALVICLTTLSLAAASADSLATKIAALQTANEITEKLTELAERCRNDKCNRGFSLDQEKVSGEVASILARADDSRVLLQVAVVSYASAYPQTASMRKIDIVFDSAWRNAVQRLRSFRAKREALESLEYLRDLLQLGGDELHTVNIAIAEISEELKLKNAHKPGTR